MRSYPVKIYKQRIIGKFIADFYCAQAKLVIEIDGSQHLTPEGRAADAERTAFLESLGLKVVRYSNKEVNMQFKNVCDSIATIIRERCSPISPLSRPDG